MGRFLDNEDILENSPGLDIAHWRLKDTGDLYIVANPERGAGKHIVVKRPDYKEGEVLIFDINGNEGPGN